jgi:alpha,alpha-trehalase
LLQTLKRAEDKNRFNISLNEINLGESAVDRTHRLIKQYYWDALTRRIDAAHLGRVVPDPKSDSADDYLYIPAADTNAVDYFESLSNVYTPQPLKIVLLPPPDKITGAFVRSLDGAHGLLSLALITNTDGTISGAPYVVPGGRFNELYCWDSYFITLGLLQDGRHDLARGMADNRSMKWNITEKFRTPTAPTISPARNHRSRPPSSGLSTLLARQTKRGWPPR